MLTDAVRMWEEKKKNLDCKAIVCRIKLSKSEASILRCTHIYALFRKGVEEGGCACGCWEVDSELCKVLPGELEKKNIGAET